MSGAHQPYRRSPQLMTTLYEGRHRSLAKSTWPLASWKSIRAIKYSAYNTCQAASSIALHCIDTPESSATFTPTLKHNHAFQTPSPGSHGRSSRHDRASASLNRGIHDGSHSPPMDHQIFRPHLRQRQHLMQVLLLHRHSHRARNALLLYRHRQPSFSRQLQQHQVRGLHHQQRLERPVWREQWLSDLGCHGRQGYYLSRI